MDTATPTTTTTTTPPPSYRPGCKPLSVELKAKILADAEGIIYTNHLIDPCKILDPDDENSWKQFVNIPSPPLSWFSPIQRAPSLGMEIQGIPLFELYSITILKLDPLRDFSAIHMRASNTHFIPTLIYKLPSGQSTPPLNSPLPITNIFQIPSAVDSVTISLSNPRSWTFFHYPLYPDEIKYGYFKKEIEDEYTDSKAVVEYQLIKEAAIVSVSFQFYVDDRSVSQVKIDNGSISIGGANRPRESRGVLQQFLSPLLVNTKDLLRLDRSIFAIGVSSSLIVELKLECTGIDGRPVFFERSPCCPVPKVTQPTLEWLLPSSDPKINLLMKLNWFDPLVY